MLSKRLPKGALLGVLITGSPLWVAASSPVANVVFFDGDFPTEPNSYVLAAQSVPGYTTGIVQPYNGASLVVSRSEASAPGGFTPIANIQVNQVLNLPATVGLNQISPRLAASYFGTLGVFDPVRATIDPPGGVHTMTQAIRFDSPYPDTVFSYSINGGPMQQWNGERLYIRDGMTVSFIGNSIMAGAPGVQKSVSYQVLMPPCFDTDGDLIPDLIEIQLGRNPLEANRDENGNLLDDVDEIVRGITGFSAGDVAPLFLDTDGDGWSDYDENLRQTNTNNPDDFPVSPNLTTIEQRLGGSMVNQSAGSSPPVGPAGKPYPTNWRVDLVDPGGQPFAGFQESNGTYTLRVPANQFRYVRSRASDGSGRMLLRVVPPQPLCIDFSSLCNNGTTVANWRAAYRASYESQIFQVVANAEVSPATTVVALLINRYYEATLNNVYTPGVTGAGPSEDAVQGLRGRRNESALFAAINAGVTPAMVDVVNDYHRFWTTPGDRPMMEVLADIFAGRMIDMEEIPAGVRIDRLAPAVNDVAALMNSLGDGTSVLTGSIFNVPGGYELVVGNISYRLSGVSEGFADGITVSLRAIVDPEGCGFSPTPARVLEVISRGLAPLPPMIDTDGDGLDDDWELYHFGDLDQDGDGDPDGDGVTNLQEQEQGLNPNLPQNDPFIGYQGDANLDMVVNALDMVIALDRQGADYTCQDCRGLGDANGSRLVTNDDLLAVGANLGLQYGGEAPCIVTDSTCKSLKSLTSSFDKGSGSGNIILVPSKTAGLVGDVIEFTVLIDGQGTGVRAASVLVNLTDNGTLRPSAVNGGSFPLLAALRANSNGLGITLGGLSEDSITTQIPLGIIRVQATAAGELTLTPAVNSPQTTFVSDSLQEFATLTGDPVTVFIGAQTEMWLLY